MLLLVFEFFQHQRDFKVAGAMFERALITPATRCTPHSPRKETDALSERNEGEELGPSATEGTPYNKEEGA